jgi:hypothetical protein
MQRFSIIHHEQTQLNRVCILHVFLFYLHCLRGSHIFQILYVSFNLIIFSPYNYAYCNIKLCVNGLMIIINDSHYSETLCLLLRNHWFMLVLKISRVRKRFWTLNNLLWIDVIKLSLQIAIKFSHYTKAGMAAVAQYLISVYFCGLSESPIQLVSLNDKIPRKLVLKE